MVAGARTVLEATAVPIAWTEAAAGEHALERSGHVLPPETLDMIRASGSALKGPTTTPSGGGHRSANFYLRHEFDLFGGVRRFVDAGRDIDVLLVRENLEDLYGAIEWEVVPGVTQALKVVTKAGSLRVSELAMRLAETRGRGRLTIVHKANNLKLTEGLFLRTAREAAADHPTLAVDDLLADSVAAMLVSAPQSLDVLLATNTFGDLLSSVAAASAGGPAITSTVNYGPGDLMVAEAGHGSAPELAGKEVANPLGLIGAAAMLLAEHSCAQEAEVLWQAIAAVRASGAVTPDLGGSASTSELADSVAAEVRSRLMALAGS